jgi:cytochrome P450
MDTLPLAFILFFIVIHWYLILSRRFLSIRTWITGNALPGVPKLSGHAILGVLPGLCKENGLRKTMEQLIQTAGEEGISYCWAGTAVFVALVDPELFKAGISQPDDVVRRGNPDDVWSPIATFHRIIGPTIFTYTGHEAKAARSHVRSMFNSDKALRETFKTIVQLCQKHIDILVSSSQDGGEDIAPFTFDLTIDLMGRLHFEQDDAHLESGLLTSTTDRISELLVSMPYIWRHGLRSLLLPKIFSDQKEEALRKTFQELVRKQITQVRSRSKPEDEAAFRALAKLSAAEEAWGQMEHFVSFIMFSTHKYGGLLLAWVLYELGRNPECLRTLRVEIDTIFSSGAMEDLNFERVQRETPYLDAVIKEILRLYPSVHATSRVVIKEFTIVTPMGRSVALKPGMILYFPIFDIQRCEKIWRTDADKFDPGRFLSMEKSVSENYFPFGFGSRGCIGYKVELQMMKVYLIILLRHYDVNMGDLEQGIRWTARLEPEKAFPFTIRKREGA